MNGLTSSLNGKLALRQPPRARTRQAAEYLLSAAAAGADDVLRILLSDPLAAVNILALYYFENLTLREIAGLMDRTEARISQILAKVLKTLRAQLAMVSNKAA